MQHKILPETLNKIFCFYSALIFCFFSNILIHTCVHSDWLHIKIKQKWCIENDKTPETAYLLQVSNEGTTGIIESCSKWKYMTLFCAPNDKFEQMLQITVCVYCQLWASVLFSYNK